MRVFISYASEDRDVAQALAIALRNRGHDVFFDRDRLRAGDEYHETILAGIEHADLFVPLLSDSYLRDGRYALAELNAALERWALPAKGIFPLDAGVSDFSRIPSALGQVTLFKPRGNAIAEFVRVVLRRLGKKIRRRFTGPILLSAAVLGSLAVVSWTLPSDLPGIGFTVVTLLRLLSASAFVGLMISSAVLLIPSVIARIALGVVPLSATLLFAGWTVFTAPSRPAIDATYGESHNIEVTLWPNANDIPEIPHSWELPFPSNISPPSVAGPSSGTRTFPTEGSVSSIKLRVPVSAKVGDDVRVHLEATLPSASAERATLFANDRIQFGQSPLCHVVTENAQECAFEGGRRRQVQWVFRAVRSGLNQLTLRFPPPAEIGSSPGEPPVALAAVDASLEITGNPRLMTDAPRIFSANDINLRVADLDLESGSIKFAYTVSDTLGVTQSAYDAATLAIVAFVGSIGGAPIWLGLIKLAQILGRAIFGFGKGRDIAVSPRSAWRR